MQGGSKKRIWGFVGLGVAIGALAFTFLIWPVIHAGTFQVSVRESGGANFSISLPVFMINAGMKLIPDAVAHEIQDEMGEEVRQYWHLAQAAVDELRNSPDFVMVRVESDHEFVEVAKKRGKLHVHVTDGDDEVKVVLPLKAIDSLLDEFAP